jgi:mono/diheme cytochrome c family protein
VLANMNLYKGVRQKDGSLDWQNPKPIEQFLTPVDITKLNFYPPHYEPKLADLGYGSATKQWKDSVYFSFGNTKKVSSIKDDFSYTEKSVNIINKNFNGKYLIDTINKVTKIYSDKIREVNPAKVQAFWNAKFNNTLLATKEFEERMTFLHYLGQDRFLELYINNLDKRMATVDSMVLQLMGVLNKNNTSSQLKSDSTNYSKGSGKALFNANCASCHHPNQNSTGPSLAYVREKWVNEGEVNLIYDFIKDNGSLRASGKSKRSVSIFNEYNGAAMQAFPALTNEDINAILDYCDENASPANIQNCSVCDFDRIINKFTQFALQNKGRVKMELGAMKLLQEYYQKHHKIYGEAAAKAQQKIQEEYTKAVQNLSADQQAKYYEDNVRNTSNLFREINDNLDETYKQLGIKRVTIPPANYTFAVANTGWHNIDRIVIENTIARNDINVSLNGKTAQIKYEPMSVVVADAEQYDRILVYLLPEQLFSFQRVMQKGTDKKFTEKLNEFYNYDLMVIGYKDDKVYYTDTKSISPKEYSFSLKNTTKADLNKILNASKSTTVKKDLIQDIADQQSLLIQAKKVEKMNNQAQFRDEVERSIFYCNSMYVTM